MTYDELKTKIRAYTEVDNNATTPTVLTDTILDGIIEDAEFRILREVDSDNNRRYVTATMVAGQRFIDTPADLLVVRSAQIVDKDFVIIQNDIALSLLVPLTVALPLFFL